MSARRETPNKTGRRRRGGARWRLAVAVSLALHGAVVALLFWQIAAAPVTIAPASGSPGMTVSLIRLPQGEVSTSAPSSPPNPRLEDMTRRLASVGDAAAPTPPPSPSGGQALLKLFADQSKPAGAPPPKASGSRSGSTGNSWAIHDFGDRYAMASAITNEALRTPTPGLWAQIAPCWHGSSNQPPLTMKMTLDARGFPTTPPTALGSSGASGADQAEDEARRALVDCAPYHAPASAGSYEIRFGSG